MLFSLLHLILPERKRTPSARVNETQRKHEPKVVDTVDIEDTAEKTVFCRCWKSKKVCLDFS